ncbi:hypothetical protein [Cellulomonas wangsupingiae]|uniref:Thiamine pyrophosphate enzyme N-terminal TPP-binding domain-containing protein n=1 Tax=Cellulomonas wangsupingiae TaxID=2968085 RepID=A0ABY5KD26_9CELL|nr:hypothetical protein [Cellulomonas wangsupingiae]MCC2334736.1 hypothetical protein [Cellulomonas wangsupingiae]MCM0638544.1 hypothetical protein [Cellulomonas wangsupingiae]UUI66308.1 hypothetical protein NP075_06220 [Cellulomonas wangsupingiae]
MSERWPFSHHVLVPCSLLAALDVLKAPVDTVHAAREEEAIAIGCGLVLGGGAPLVAMQNSGLASALNTLGSLAVAYQIGVCLLVSVRGDEADSNPAQRPVGRATRALLDSLDVPHSTAKHPADLWMLLPDAARSAARDRRPHAVLIDREVVDA